MVRQSFEQAVRAQYIVGVQREAADPVLFSQWDDEITLPVGGSAFTEQLLTPARTGGVLWLSRYGKRLVGVLPADVVESILNQPLDPAEKTTADMWAVWQHQVRSQARSQGSLLERAIAAGEVEPPRRTGTPRFIPELVDLPSLADALIAARERERGQ